MGSRGVEEASNQFQEEEEEDIVWDFTAEEALKAIEDSYYSISKRSLSDPNSDSSNQRSMRRRLPNWATATATATTRQWRLSPPPCRPRYPSINFSGRIVYCRTAPEVESATAELLEKLKVEEGKLSRMPLGFDIEWRPTFKRGEVPRKAAVMQICADVANCYVMHIVHSGIPPALKSLLEDSSTVKVGVGIANDATKMSKDYNVRVEPLEELSGYANLKLGGAPKRWSLSSLTESLTCKQLEKPGKIRMGNWEVDVLSKEQLHYAATDAFVSWYLHQILMTFPDAKRNDENTGNDAVS